LRDSKKKISPTISKKWHRSVYNLALSAKRGFRMEEKTDIGTIEFGTDVEIGVVDEVFMYLNRKKRTRLRGSDCVATKA
jgi:hypothetical protein